MEGQCSIAQFLGQPGARLMNISFILKYFKSYWDVRKYMISKDTEHPKTTRYKKEINYRLTNSPRYLGFVLTLQHLHFFPLASSSSGWFFGISSLSPFHHIGFLCLFLLMKLWHPQQIFYKSSELNQKESKDHDQKFDFCLNLSVCWQSNSVNKAAPLEWVSLNLQGSY